MTLTAIFSDIHGNLPALEACVADAEARGCTQFLNLGDILSGPLWPRETADYLMKRDWPTLRGNHERALIAGDPRHMGRSDSYAAAALDARHIDWLRSLRPTLQWRNDVYLCHSTPSDDDTYLLHRVEPNRIRDAHADELLPVVDGVTSTLIGCGHSHLQRRIQLPDGRILFNPGSVGLPGYAWEVPHVHRMEAGTSHARYAILHGEGDSADVTLISVDYDQESAAARAEANGRTDWATPLRTGFVD